MTKDTSGANDSSGSSDGDASKSKKQSTTSHIVIWVALIGLLGTLGAAVLANWDKLFPSDPVVQESPRDEAESELEPKVAVEKLAGRWCAAWLGGDAGTFVSLASEPFFFDQNIVLTKSELRSNYMRLYDKKGDLWRDLQISSIKVQTARELKEEGYDLSQDRIFSSLNLTLDDYAVTVMTAHDGREEGMLLVVRRVGKDYEVVGTWD